MRRTRKEFHLYFVSGSFDFVSTISFYVDDDRYGIPCGRGCAYAKEFTAQEQESFLKAELCRIREEATLYVSSFFDPAMVQRVVDSLNHQGRRFHIGAGSSDLLSLEIISRCNCRDYALT